MNRRRKLILSLGASTLTATFASQAQRADNVWRIGFLNAGPDSNSVHRLASLRAGLADLGYIESKHYLIDRQSADGSNERLPALAMELLQLKPDVLVSNGTPSTIALQKATNTIPIVMVAVSDPVRSGLVKSLARPGGNTTGLSNLTNELGPKLLEILRSVVPQLSLVAILTNPSNPSLNTLREHIQSAGDTGRIKVLPFEARLPQDVEAAFSAMAREGIGGLIVAQDLLFIRQIHQIAALAAKHRLPTISGTSDYPTVGGLMSYASDNSVSFRRAAIFLDKIFKGAKPSDLPVELPTKFELIINVRTASALGLKIPQALLISAAKIIE